MSTPDVPQAARDEGRLGARSARPGWKALLITALVAGGLTGVFLAMAAGAAWVVLSVGPAPWTSRLLPVSAVGMLAVGAAKGLTDRLVKRAPDGRVAIWSSIGAGFGAAALVLSSSMSLGQSHLRGTGMSPDGGRAWSHRSEALDLAAVSVAAAVAVGAGVLFAGLLLFLCRRRMRGLGAFFRAASWASAMALAVLVAVSGIRRVRYAGVEDRLAGLEPVSQLPLPGRVVSEVAAPNRGPSPSPTRAVVLPGPFGERRALLGDVTLLQVCSDAGCHLALPGSGSDVPVAPKPGNEPAPASPTPGPLQKWDEDLRVYKDVPTGSLFLELGGRRLEVFDTRRGTWLEPGARSPLVEGASPPLSWLLSASLGLGVAGCLLGLRARKDRYRTDAGQDAPEASEAATAETLGTDAGLLALVLLAGAPLIAAAVGGLVF